MNSDYYIQTNGYVIFLSYDEKSSLWCADLSQLGAMGQGKTKAEAIKDLGSAMIDLMDSYINDGVELPFTVLKSTVTTAGSWSSSEPYKK